MITIALAACRSVPLDEASIEGGTADQQEIVAEELARFDRWIGEGRIQLRWVEFGHDDNEGGAYGWKTRVMRLGDELDGSRLRTVVLHELCHAVDVQDGALDGYDDAFVELRRHVRDDLDHPLNDVARDGSRRRELSELFAYVCEHGPAGTDLLEDPCPGDPEEATDAARWIARNIWTGDPDIAADSAFAVGGGASWTAPFEIDRLAMVGDDGDVVVLGALGADEEQVRVMLDLDTGEEVEATVESRWEPLIAELPSPLPVGVGTIEPYVPAASFEAESLVEDDRALALITRARIGRLAGLRDFAPHLLGWDGAAWSVVPGACPTRVSTLFAAGGGFHVAWAEGATVHWRRIE